VFRSLHQGDSLKPISPEISRTKRGTASALAESPRNADVLWAGTDDGYLWISRDGGAKWTNITTKVGLPGFRWVASIEASRAVDGRAYVVFDGHRSDDDEPYVYVTEDFGETWKSLRANLPSGSTRVLREDIENPNLLYLGTEFGAWASLDQGKSWTKINNNLPTVAVHEFAQPTGGVDEIVAATHGRSLWILDVSALRELSADTLKADAFLYKPATVVRYLQEPPRGSIYGTGSRKFAGENPPPGAQIYYSLGKKPAKINLKVVDYTGVTVREIEAKPEVGLQHVAWDLRKEVPGAAQQQPGAGRGGGRQGGGGPGGAGGGGGFGGGRGFGGQNAAAPGMYRIVLTVDGKEYTQSLKVEGDPNRQGPIIAEEDEDEDGQ
jgi:hypothetical protein